MSTRRLYSQSTTSRLIDLLEADGGWFTMLQLEADLPDVKPLTLRRSMHRLHDYGVIEQRQIPEPRSQVGYITAWRLRDIALSDDGRWLVEALSHG